jgi:hypothetical protein
MERNRIVEEGRESKKKKKGQSLSTAPATRRYCDLSIIHVLSWYTKKKR